MELVEGAVLGRYRIEGFLGAGGMGRVYVAFDTTLKRRVAIKLLSSDRAGNAGAAARFVREARAAAAFSHPNTVAVHDVGEHEQQPFIVMEYVEGASLRQLVADRKKGLRERLTWALELASALAATHRANVVHRDIKPDNVMIASDGKLKLLDFGVAKLDREEESARRGPDEAAPASFRTAEGTVVGTPRYMAPEQLRGDSVGPRTDQYAWAVVSYETLSGRHPFPRESLRGTVAPLLSELVPSLPFGVAAVVAKAMAPEAPERFDSMDEIVRALEPLVAEAQNAPAADVEEATMGPTPSLATTRTHASSRRAEDERPGTRNRWVVAASLLVVAAVAVFVVVERRPPAPVSPPPPTSAVVSVAPPQPVASPKAAAARFGAVTLPVGTRGYPEELVTARVLAKADAVVACAPVTSSEGWLCTWLAHDAAGSVYAVTPEGPQPATTRDCLTNALRVDALGPPSTGEGGRIKVCMSIVR